MYIETDEAMIWKPHYELFKYAKALQAERALLVEACETADLWISRLVRDAPSPITGGAELVDQLSAALAEAHSDVRGYNLVTAYTMTLAMLRWCVPHLGSVGPTCGCDACELERQIVAALDGARAAQARADKERLGI